MAVAAGLETLKLVQASGFYERLAARTAQLTDGLSQAARELGIAFSAQSVGGMFGLYFSAETPSSYLDVMQSDKAAFNRFFHQMLQAGIYFAPSAFEAGFVSAAHGDAEIEQTLAAARKAFSA